MGESLLLPLRSSSTKDPSLDTLRFLIPQINAQRGGFRDLSEQSLKEEVLTASSDDVALDDEEDADLPEDVQARRKNVYEKRNEMSLQVGEAVNSAMMAQDFLSLLLSKFSPKAEQTMSPVLKTLVPTGTVDVDVVHRPTNDLKPETHLVSKGWKLESLNSAADSLLRSASRLEGEIVKETEYWSQILAIKESGWAVCRMPNERQTLGVKYGFREASAAFKDKSLAALRREDDGSIKLDRGPSASHQKRLRVKVKAGDQIIGTSVSKTVIDNSIGARLTEIRDAIYDEELFFEISREARNLTNQGVEVRENAIQFTYDDNKVILISLEFQDEVQDHGQEELLATSISAALRLLLSHMHHQNYNNRTQIPTPLTLLPRPNPPISLLCPILAYVQHSSHVRGMVAFLTGLFKPLKSAGLQYAIEKSPFTSSKLSTLLSSESLISSMTSNLDSILKITFPSSAAAAVTLTIKTALVLPTQGTEYSLKSSVVNVSQYRIPSNLPRITSASEVQDIVSKMLSLDIMTTIGSISRDHILSRQDHQEVPSKKSLNISSMDVWVPSDPLNNELSKTVSITSSLPRKAAKMRVAVSESSLSIKWSWVHGVVGSAEYSWTDEIDMVDPKTLAQFINEAAT